MGMTVSLWTTFASKIAFCHTWSIAGAGYEHKQVAIHDIPFSYFFLYVALVEG
jgi:hypothetical protein